MSKELEALMRIAEYRFEECGVVRDDGTSFEGDCTIIENSLLKAQEDKKILKIIKESPFILQKIFENKGLKNQENFDKKYFWGTITDDKVKIVEKWLDE